MKDTRKTLDTCRAGVVAERDRWERLLQGLQRTQKPARRGGTSQSQASGLEVRQAPRVTDLLLRGPAGRHAIRAVPGPFSAAEVCVTADTMCGAGEAPERDWPAACHRRCCPEGEPRGRNCRAF